MFYHEKFSSCVEFWRKSLIVNERLADLYHVFLGHFDLFQAIENYVTPEQTLNTLQKVIDWLKELIQVYEYEPELKSEILICYEGQKVKVVAKTKSQKLYISKWRFTREPCKKNAIIWSHVYMLQMASILMLQNYADTGANIYKVFDVIQLKDSRNWHNPFEEVENEEVLRMVYKWLATQSGKVKTVQLRIHNDSQNIMHYVGCQVHATHVYVRYAHDLPSNPQWLTHVWRPYTSFVNLTIEEIRNSIRRAREINNRAIAKQTEEIFANDKLIEQWLPETNDPEASHVNDNKAYVNEILQFLQEENLT